MRQFLAANPLKTARFHHCDIDRAATNFRPDHESKPAFDNMNEIGSKVNSILKGHSIEYYFIRNLQGIKALRRKEIVNFGGVKALVLHSLNQPPIKPGNQPD